MKVLAVGGGSGGHVTPVIAVLKEVKRRHPRAELRVWCDYTFATQAKGMIGGFDKSIQVDRIVAGKLRRFHHLTLVQHFIIPSVFWPNLRDIILVFIGVVQSIVKLIIWRPDVVFTKGGYVCLPVGWAAWLLRIPVVIHDSDAHPGLTNRLLARLARTIATGAPLEYYSYPADKAVYIGVPVGEQFVPFTPEKKKLARQNLGIFDNRPLVVITGGGLGARRINDAVAQHLPDLLEQATIVLIAGSAQYDELRAITPRDDERFRLYDFVSTGMADMLGAADVVVTRAGATTILELAALAKPIILVPNGRLTGGHQLKNAQVYSDKKAALIINDDALEQPDDTSLVDTLRQLLSDKALQSQLSRNIHKFARPNAASDMADIILQAARH